MDNNRSPSRYPIKLTEPSGNVRDVDPEAGRGPGNAPTAEAKEEGSAAKAAQTAPPPTPPTPSLFTVHEALYATKPSVKSSVKTGRASPGGTSLVPSPSPLSAEAEAECELITPAPPPSPKGFPEVAPECRLSTPAAPDFDPENPKESSTPLGPDLTIADLEVADISLFRPYTDAPAKALAKRGPLYEWTSEGGKPGEEGE